MSDTFEIKTATRQGIKPLIGLYGESGCGKTYSSLLLARGLVGPSGKIVMVDTESGRGSLYADVLPGGYDVLDLGEPFSPSRYQDAMHAAAKAGAAIVVLDSMSHEWEGIGGVLDMAHQIEERSGKPGLHCWKEPKLAHARMMLALLQSPLPVVCCLRAHFKSRQGKDDRGKTVIIKDDHTTPIQSEAFIYEMTAHAEILQDHSIILTKCSHPALRDCFPKTGPITIHTGEAIAKWCAAPSLGAPASPASDRPAGEKASEKAKRNALKGQLWNLTRKVHGVEKQDDGDMILVEAGMKNLSQWLWDEGIMDPNGETLAGVSVDRLAEIVEKVKARQ